MTINPPTRRKSRARPKPPVGRRLETLLFSRSVWTLPFSAGALYLFVEYVRPQEKYELLSGLPLGEASVALLLVGAVLGGTGVRAPGSTGKWIAALLVWALICSAVAERPSVSLTAYVEMLKVVGPYFVIVASIRSKEQVYVLVLWVMAICFLHTNFSFRMWAAAGFVGAGGGAYVGSGFLQNPNDYGAALAAFWGMSLLLAVKDPLVLRGRIPVRRLHQINTFLFFVGVLTSSSRGAALAVLAGALYYIAVVVPGARKRIAAAVVVLIAIGGFVALLSESQSARFEGMGSQEDESAEDRRRTWRVAGMVISDNPVFGVGVGQFLLHARRYPTEGPIFVQHNIVLQAASDLGLPGLAMLIALIVSFFGDMKKVQTRLKPPRGDPLLAALALGLKVSMVSFLVAGQFITVLFYPFLWTLLILSTALHRVTAIPQSRRPTRAVGSHARIL